MYPLVLIILDGWGIRSQTKNNGIALAQKPNFDFYWKNYPHTQIEASGPAVGLPKGVIGNSEVGHMNLGAGRIVYTGLSQIYQSIQDTSFFKNKVLLEATNATKKNNSSLHLMGLVSDGAVHSHQDHLYALLELAKQQGVKKVFVHCFMDGRDTPPSSGLDYIQQLEEKINQLGIGRIASIHGRFYAMDRDKRWERIQKSYDVLVESNQQGEISAQDLIKKSYQQGITDEFIVPSRISQTSPTGLTDSDAVIFFNFRADRARQITQALTDENFSGFKRSYFPKLSCFVCMAPYDVTFKLPIAYTPNYPKGTLAEILSEKGLSQLRIAETEKYAHVTYFFSGGREKELPGEKRILIPSPREVATYDLAPEMSALKITEDVCRLIAENQLKVIILNFANSDMVGHTAKPSAIIKAIGILDDCLQKVVSQTQKVGGQVIITSDHGNAEQMIDDQGKPHTAHTLNPVPFIIVSDKLKKISLKKSGGLCDVAPTMLEMLGVNKPKEMTGESLIETS